MRSARTLRAWPRDGILPPGVSQVRACETGRPPDAEQGEPCFTGCCIRPG